MKKNDLLNDFVNGEWRRKTSKPKAGSRPMPSPGFYTPMGIAPGEYPPADYGVLKEQILLYIERDWGKRCETKDYEDFPELHDNLMPVGDDAGRCPVCVVYERFDRFWERLIPHGE